MRETETPTNAKRDRAAGLPRPPRDETARLGKEVYERDIRRLVEASHHGEVVAIDVESGSYALGKNAIAASESLRRHYPDAQIWLMRVGHRTLYRFGGGSIRKGRPVRGVARDASPGIFPCGIRKPTRGSV